MTTRLYDPAAALAAARITGQRPPAYGTEAWAALPDDHPGKHAAVLLAAECWRRYWAPDMTALRAEATERDRRARLRQMSADLAEGLDWRRQATAPSYATLDARRARPAATVTVPCAEPGCDRRFTRPAHLARPGGQQAGPRCWCHGPATATGTDLRRAS